MRLLPLILSARLFALPPKSGLAHPSDQGAKGSCRFCGFSAAGWLEPFFYGDDLPDQHTRPGIPGGIPCCALCHLALSLDRDAIDREGLLIWCPHLSQGLLNCLVRSSHVSLAQSGSPFDLSRKPPKGDSAAHEAAHVLACLRAQSESVVAKFGTAAPSALHQALTEIKRQDGRLDPGSISGLRLFPMGRFFRGGEDIYPKLMSSLLKRAAKE